MSNTILQLVFSQPWFCHQTGMDPLLVRIAHFLTERNAAPKGDIQQVAGRVLVDAYGDELPQMTMREDGVAVVPVSGPLAKRVGSYDQWAFGIADYDHVQADIEEAIDRGAAAVLLDMNSPGGSVVGVSELAQFIANTSEFVPIGSFNGVMSASAAEYLSAGATVRMASPSAINGSIGTIAQVPNFTEYLNRIGVTMHTFTSGDLKATGNPYNPMTLAQAASIQSRVESLGTEFRDWMQAQRGTMPAEMMRGQVLTTSEALKIGLIDAEASSVDEAAALLLQHI